jgi:hypothetical protein
LGISLEEVQAWYFTDHLPSEALKGLAVERNYGDMMENHYWSGGYLTEDIDGVPFVIYNSDD